MSVAKNKRTVSPQRRGLSAKIHIAKKELGWSDEQYVEWLEANFGKSSSKGLTFDEFERAIDLLKQAGWKPKKTTRSPRKAGTKRNLPQSPMQKKIRALWITLYHLGAVRKREETALDSHCKRVCIGHKGQDKIQFGLYSVTEHQAYLVIESLKKMAERAGVDWSSYQTPNGAWINDRARVIEAQWRKLGNRTGDGFSDYLIGFFHDPSKASHLRLQPSDADRLIEHFGERIREQETNEGRE